MENACGEAVSRKRAFKYMQYKQTLTGIVAEVTHLGGALQADSALMWCNAASLSGRRGPMRAVAVPAKRKTRRVGPPVDPGAVARGPVGRRPGLGATAGAPCWSD